MQNFGKFQGGGGRVSRHGILCKRKTAFGTTIHTRYTIRYPLFRHSGCIYPTSRDPIDTRNVCLVASGCVSKDRPTAVE